MNVSQDSVDPVPDWFIGTGAPGQCRDASGTWKNCGVLGIRYDDPMEMWLRVETESGDRIDISRADFRAPGEVAM